MKKPHTVKKVVFLGRKIGALTALEFLRKNRVKVACIVNPSRDEDSRLMKAYARKHGILFLSDDATLYAMIAKNDKRLRDTDLVISYLYPRRIKDALIKLGSRGCINFHPAPLPDYKSRAGYNTAILEERKTYGVSSHYIDSEQFDAGPIIEVRSFTIDPAVETAYSLEAKSQTHLTALFEITIKRFLSGRKIKTYANEGGLYLTGVQLEELKKIDPADSEATINRKIRAFFFPPYQGATIEIQGTRYTLINQTILDILAQRLPKNPL